MVLTTTVLLVHNDFGLITEFVVCLFRPVPQNAYAFYALGAYVCLKHLSSRTRISVHAETAPVLPSLPRSLWRSSPSIAFISRNHTNYIYASTTSTIARLPARTFRMSYSC